MDLKRIREILDLVEEKDLEEFELEEPENKLRVRRRPSPSQVQAVLPAAGVGPTLATAPAPPVPRPAPTLVALPPRSSVAEAAEAAGMDATIVTSPIVGTFYRSPDPNSPPFVNIGDRVRVGQVLCIIEAMKLMNEIECEVAGVILKIHQENGQPVQFGAPLFAIQADK